MDLGVGISKISVWIRNQHLQNTMCAIFSQNGQLLIFQPKFREIAQLREPNIVESVAESWVEAEMSWVEVKMSWVEVDAARWSWMELGAWFSNTDICFQLPLRSSHA